MPGFMVSLALPETLIWLYVPGLMTSMLLPLTLTAPSDVPAAGAGNVSRGSGIELTPVIGDGLTLALPDLLTFPTTLILLAVTLALPLAEMAEAELESTSSGPVILMAALPDTVSAPL